MLLKSCSEHPRELPGDFHPIRRWVIIPLASLLALVVAAAIFAHFSSSAAEADSAHRKPEQQEEVEASSPSSEPPAPPQVEPPPPNRTSQLTPPPRICRSFSLRVTLKEGDLAGPEAAVFSENTTLEVLSVRGSCTAALETSVEARFESGYLILTVSVPSPTPCHRLEVTNVAISKNSVTAELRLVEPEGFCVQCLGSVKAEIKLGPAPPGKYSACLTPLSC
ncbi:MAG: hypothetical protein QXT33_06120 [Thermofilum sp.]